MSEYTVRKSTLEDIPFIFELIENEGDEWRDYWGSDGRGRSIKKLLRTALTI